MNLELPSLALYAILDTAYSYPQDWPDLAGQLIAGGVGIIQIRAKKASPSEILAWTRMVQPITKKHNVPLIINDHPEIAAEVGAEGCHVGQDDLSVAEVRRICGANAIIGKSTHSIPQVIAAAEEKPDYIGFGPIFPTLTKPDYPSIGLDSISQVPNHISCPFFCIGGINLETLPKIKAMGARRVVIVSALLTAPDPAAYAQEVISTLTS